MKILEFIEYPQHKLEKNYRSTVNGLLPCLIAILLCACAGTRTFPGVARSGSTVALELGWIQNLSRKNMTITITDSTGLQTVYPPNDLRVRGIYNEYPDPVSKLVVGAQTNQNIGIYANATSAASIINSRTGSDPDWSQTTLLIDLPDPMATGVASIAVSGPSGQVTPNPIYLTINGTGGVPASFNSQTNGPVNDYMALIERAPNYKVTFNGNVVPHSIQLSMTHTYGVGMAWVTNPRGDLKNITWTDYGSLLIVMLTPTNGVTPDNLLNFKFYVAGGIANLTYFSVRAYDINGNPISGIITPQITSQ